MSVAARRYAKGIFALAQETQAVDAIAAELERLAALARDPVISNTLGNPLLSAPARKAVARTLGEQLQLSRTTRNFLGLLADHKRLDQLVGIFDHYRKLHDTALGQVRAQITSAVPLSPAQETDLVTTFAQLSGKRVLATPHVDPEILGGVVVEIEGKVYDGSLRTQLGRLAGSIAGSRSGL
jgi:F-type H+-transporting ATPase subunit delta